MIPLIRPLSIAIDMEDREYRLGQPIDLTVELNVVGSAEVREGRVELVCELRYTGVYTVMVPVSRPGPPMRRFPAHLPTTRVPKHVAEDHKETIIHSSAVFLRDTRLDGDSPGRHHVRLAVRQEPPPLARVADMKWKLVVTLDVAHALDVKTQRPVTVIIPQDSG